MNVLVIVAALLAIRMVLLYFGVLGSSSAAQAYLRASSALVLPLGLPAVRSLYGGVFDANAAATVIICLVAEWGLAVWRQRLGDS